MGYFLLKILISAIVIATVSELGKKSTTMAVILASLPLTSILAMIWLYYDTYDSNKIIALSHGIFWVVLPSLLFFLILPCLLKNGFKFGFAMATSSVAMIGAYLLYVWILKKLGIHL